MGDLGLQTVRTVQSGLEGVEQARDDEDQAQGAPDPILLVIQVQDS